MNFNWPKNYIYCLLTCVVSFCGHAQNKIQILEDAETASRFYLPDFSYAGYHFGLKTIPSVEGTVILATDYGVIPDDNKDDSQALIKAISAADSLTGKVIIQLPSGRIELSEVLYLTRSETVLRGAGSGPGGTEIFCPRPMMYFKDPASLAELRDYLESLDKRQIEKENNINLPFSQYAWSGGMIWTGVPGERVKYYLEKYESPKEVISKVVSGLRGNRELIVTDSKKLKPGDVLLLEVFNRGGNSGALLSELYVSYMNKAGSHHWNFPGLPMVTQQVQIESVSGNKVRIKTPLTINVKQEYDARLVAWPHLEEVGIEHIKITFPDAPIVAHHVEQGFNGIYLTRLFNSWVKDVTIENADSGILTEEIANVTIADVITNGVKKAHYAVYMGGVHNVLAQNIKVFNKVVHPLSFNTFATKSVYLDCSVYQDAILDQHAGANHQNLFDNIEVYVTPDKENKYPLFAGGGAPYWKPSHGAYSTFWNINVHLTNYHPGFPVILNGMNDGPYARIIGVHANYPVQVAYGPEAYIESINTTMERIPSLYRYQLDKRKKE